MDPARWQRVRDVFMKVCDLDAARREPALESACGSDAALRSEVEALLASSEDSSELLDAAPDLAGTEDGTRPTTSSQPGSARP